MKAAALEDLDWLDDALAVIAEWARTGSRFTSEDLRQSHRPAPSKYMPGNAFQMARKAGLIQVVGYKLSTDKSRKGGIVRVWEGINT